MQGTIPACVWHSLQKKEVYWLHPQGAIQHYCESGPIEKIQNVKAVTLNHRWNPNQDHKNYPAGTTGWWRRRMCPLHRQCCLPLVNYQQDLMGLGELGLVLLRNPQVLGGDWLEDEFLLGYCSLPPCLKQSWNCYTGNDSICIIIQVYEYYCADQTGTIMFDFCYENLNCIVGKSEKFLNTIFSSTSVTLYKNRIHYRKYTQNLQRMCISHENAKAPQLWKKKREKEKKKSCFIEGGKGTSKVCAWSDDLTSSTFLKLFWPYKSKWILYDDSDKRDTRLKR